MEPVNSVSEGREHGADRKAWVARLATPIEGTERGALIKNLVTAGKFGGSLFVLLRPNWE
jgi:hypothetical protein